MNNDCNLIPEIIGVMGTLLGTILGWLLSNLSQRGKLNIYPTWRDEFQHNDGYGGLANSKSQEEAKYYMYYLTFDLYNSSGESQIMRNVEISFARNKEELFTDIPEDDSTGRSNGVFRVYDKVLPITIPAKSVFTIKLHGGFEYSDERFSKIWKTNIIMMSYMDGKNKEKKILLKKADFSQYFEQFLAKEDA